MLDRDMRAALRRSLPPGVHVVDEMGIRQGVVRVDVAAVLPDELHGYEIKSPADNLRRLPGQIAGYSAVLDRAAIVLTEGHRAAALAMVPEWWGVLVLEGDSLAVERPARPNPSIDPRALAELLWHEQTLDLLRFRGAARGVRGKPRAAAWDRLVEVLTLDEIREAVRGVLRSRRPRRAESGIPARPSASSPG